MFEHRSIRIVTWDKQQEYIFVFKDAKKKEKTLQTTLKYASNLDNTVLE